jgi:hypothetical protein
MTFLSGQGAIRQGFKHTTTCRLFHGDKRQSWLHKGSSRRAAASGGDLAGHFETLC